MTAHADRLTPPRPRRTPAEHFAIADRLVADLDELHVHELQLPYAKAKLALADIHARLAGCVGPTYVLNDNQPDGRNLP